MAKARVSPRKKSQKVKPQRQLESPKEKNSLQVILQPRSEGGQELSFIDSVRFLREAALLLEEKAEKLLLSAGFDPNFDPHNPPQQCLSSAHLSFWSVGYGLGKWLAKVPAGKAGKGATRV